MCDPLTIAAMAASVGLSVGGGIVNRGETLRNEASQAVARNKELRDLMTKQSRFEADNRSNLAHTIDQFQQPAQETAQGNAENTRASEATANITPVDKSVSEIPLSGDTPQVIRSAVADRMKDAFDKSTNVARERAKLGSFGDAWGGNNRAIGATERDVNTTNNFSKAEGDMLPNKQALAAYLASKRPSGLGSTMQALGGLAASAAGAGAGGPPSTGIDATGFYNQMPSSFRPLPYGG